MISNILQKVINNETVRYVVSGIFTMAIGVGVYQGFLLLGLDYKISNLISLVAGKMSAYICNKFFVFKVRNTSFSEWIKEYLRFIFARGATLFIDYFGLIFLVEVVEFNKIYSKYAIVTIVLILNYILGKLIVFRKTNDKK